MVPADVFGSPILWFAAMILVGWLLYLWAGRVAPPFLAVGEKAKAYTGGEAIPGQTYQPGYQFFHVALFFTIMHVAALVVATAPSGVFPAAALAYVAVIALSVVALRWN